MDWIGPLSDDRYRGVAGILRRTVLAAGFWGAIVLPLVAIPTLVIVPGARKLIAVALVTNVVCLVVGQRHDPRAGWLRRSTEHSTGEAPR